MSYRQLVEKAAAQGLTGTVVQSEARTSLVTFEFSRLKGLESTEELSTVVQVIKDGKLGIAASSRAGGGGDELLANAAEVSEFGAPVQYGLPQAQARSQPVMYDPAVAALDPKTLIGYGEQATGFLKKLHPDIQVLCMMDRTVMRKTVANTAGLDAGWDKTAFELYVRIELVQGKDFLSVGEGIATTRMDFDLDGTLNNIADDFAAAQRVVGVKPGAYDVLFRPVALEYLVSPVLSCVDGGAVVRGVSPLAGRIGEEILPPLFTLVEDGALDGGVGSAVYDDQGVACRRNILVKGGVLQEYLLDLDSAARLGRRPTGTGGLTRPRANNVLLLPGATPWREMLAGIERGIVIDETIGAWAGNPYSGQVSGNIGLGFLVENGKIVGRVKDCMFSINVFTQLKTQLKALSLETKALGTHILPWALVSGVSISTRQG